MSCIAELDVSFNDGFQGLLFFAGSHIHEDGELAGMLATGGLDTAVSPYISVRQPSFLFCSLHGSFT